eukprot:SAG11_NODE_1397_length_5032_cov_14.008109_2_plen_69_part_00
MLGWKAGRLGGCEGARLEGPAQGRGLAGRYLDALEEHVRAAVLDRDAVVLVPDACGAARRAAVGGERR